MSLLIITIGVIFVITFQSRSLILPLLFPIIYHLLNSRGVTNKLLVSALGLLFISIFFSLQQYRYVGLESFDIEVAISNIVALILNGEGELSIINTFYYLMEEGESVVGFSNGWSYLRVLFFYLPSGWLDIKPDDFSYEIWNSFTGVHNVGGSLHPTHYGMAFGNLSWIGAFIGPIFILFFNYIYGVTIKVFNSNEMLTMSSFLSGTVLMARGSIYNGFVIIIVGLILSLFVHLTFKIKYIKH